MIENLILLLVFIAPSVLVLVAQYVKDRKKIR